MTGFAKSSFLVRCSYVCSFYPIWSFHPSGNHLVNRIPDLFKSVCTRDGRSLLHELSKARLRFWRNLLHAGIGSKIQLWTHSFGHTCTNTVRTGLQRGHFLGQKISVFWPKKFSPKPSGYVWYRFLGGFQLQNVQYLEFLSYLRVLESYGPRQFWP